MLHPQIDALVPVTEKGSFFISSERMFLFKASVKNQMYALGNFIAEEKQDIWFDSKKLK